MFSDNVVGDCKVVLELSPYGSLLRYLHRHRASNVGYIEINNGSGGPQECSMRPGVLRLCHFCRQIAAGMEYLTAKHVSNGSGAHQQ